MVPAVDQPQLFVTWLYEMLFLIRERVDDQVVLTRAREAATRAELDALRSQVDPHFLFNALNTLAALVDTEPDAARSFVHDLARVYRRLLDTRGRPLVPLSEELDLARAYARLLEIRFEDAVQVTVDDPDDIAGRALPPGAVQVLLENAIRHNAVDPDDPLSIEVLVEEDAVVVRHARRRRGAHPGAGTGLSNLDARCRAATGRGIDVDDGDPFVVRVPLADAS